MNTLPLTRFGLRLVGIVCLLRAALDTWDWALPLMQQGFAGNWKFVSNTIFKPLHYWASFWPGRVVWLALVAVGLVLVFRNAWLARLLWRGLESSGCAKCGYDRRGIANTAPCPECGAPAPTT